MKVYVIRHGQSETNAKGCWTGWLDVNLTEKGGEDARSAGKIIQDIAFDKIYTSDLTRAIHTATTAIPGCEFESTPLLREINVGSIANKPLGILTNEQREKTRSVGYTEFGGESIAQFHARIDEFKSKLECLNAENVAVFSHAGWLRAMLDSIVGMVLPRNTIACGNCTIGVFEYSNGKWRLHSWINI